MTKMLQIVPSLTDQIYDAIVDEICSGRLKPGTHLVQERLAESFGVSRQPIQQTMARLKADGMVEEVGRRGLFVARLDPDRMLDHYGVRAALDAWAAKAAARRLAADPKLKRDFISEGTEIMVAAQAAIDAGDVAELVRQDSAFHFHIYSGSGNELIAETAEPHWRFLRRAMGDVLRKAEAPGEIWRQHRAILDAVISGNETESANLAEFHANQAALLLADALTRPASEDDAP